jgi:TRAP transporter TAXI family solute receptor
MKMKKRKIFCLLLAVLILLCSCSGESEAATGGKYRLATGKAGGTYYSLGTCLASVWDKYSQSTTNISTTEGSVTNLEMLQKEDADFGFMQSDILHYAIAGEEMYLENKQKGVSVVGTLYSEYAQFVVNASTEIKTIPDLNGKTVAVGKYGTATEAAARKILEAYGITYDMITVKYQTFSEAMNGLNSGSIDAAFAVSSLPSANILEYSQTHEIRFLPISLTQSTAFKRSCPFFREGMILNEVYGTSNSVSTVCVDVLLICRNNMPSADVFAITSSIFNNTDEVVAAHAKGDEINAVTAAETLIGSIHSGAKDYYNNPGEEAKKEDKKEEETSSESEPETSSETE